MLFFAVAHVFKSYLAMLLGMGHLIPYIHPARLGGAEIPTPLAKWLVSRDFGMARSEEMKELFRAWSKIGADIPKVMFW